MPYALVKPGGIEGLRADLATRVDFTHTSDWALEYEFATESSSFVFDGGGWDQNHAHGSTIFRIRRAAQTVVLSQTLTTGVTDFDHVHLVAPPNPDLAVLTINGIVENESAVMSGDIFFKGFFAVFTVTNTSAQAFKYVKLWRDGALIHHWTNTTGTGLVWTDIVGGNDAALNGAWPVDDSQWVFYSDGPATPTLTLPTVTGITVTSAVPNVTVTF